MAKRQGPELKKHVNSAKGKAPSRSKRSGAIMGPKLDKHANNKGK